MVRRGVSNTPGPVRCSLKKGYTYYYCTCGKSQNQPLCDSSHVGSRHEPIKTVASEDKVVVMCGCKLTKTPPYCDGSHKAIAQERVDKILESESSSTST